MRTKAARLCRDIQPFRFLAVNASRQFLPRRFSTLLSLSRTNSFSVPLKTRTVDGLTTLLLGQCRGAATSSTSIQFLKRTPLYDFHVDHGATMVPFGGFQMPLQYPDQGLVQSHEWTRHKASLFDVSHMVQHELKGPGAENFLSRLTPAGLANLESHHSILSCFLHPGTGGIVDDTVITRTSPGSFYFVTNAGCREKDLAYLQANLETWFKEGQPEVQWTVLEDQGLVALQGPSAAKLLEPLIANWAEKKLEDLHFGQCVYAKLHLNGDTLSSPVLLSRGGYTGEDGFEISISPADTVSVVEEIMRKSGPDQLRLAGLGARDSLRLEAGMCLYGHDLDDATTPVEAGLSWVISKDRRTKFDFNGSEVILQQLKPNKDGGTGVTRRRVGLIVEGAPAREGAEIVDEAGEHVGRITSGCPSPTLRKNIAMGYVKSGCHKAGTKLFAIVRGKRRKAVVTKMPFVPAKYWRGGLSAG